LHDLLEILPLEERLEGLSLEDRLQGLPLEELERLRQMLQDRTKANDSSHPGVG
jgi:hypothetical protein